MNSRGRKYNINKMRRELMAIILLTMAYVAYGMGECPLFKCSKDVEEGFCAYANQIKDDTMINLNPCKNDLVCNYEDLIGKNTAKCVKPEKSLGIKYPGEYCEQNEECTGFTSIGHGMECQDNTCMGKEENEPCTFSMTCAPEYYCNVKAGKCLTRGKLNDDCTSEMGSCDTPYVCVKEKCVRAGTLEVGEPIDNDFACKTLYSENGRCAVGPKLKGYKEGTGPMICHGNCTYIIGKSPEAHEPCTCGHTETGTKFCNPGYGDVNFSDIFAYYHYMEHYNLSCHSYYGNLPLCQHKPLSNMSVQYKKAMTSFYRVLEWSAFTSNPDCVKKTFTSYYWELIDDIEHNIGTTDEVKKQRKKAEESNAGMRSIGVYMVIIIILAILATTLAYYCLYRNESDSEPEKKKSPEEIALQDYPKDHNPS